MFPKQRNIISDSTFIKPVSGETHAMCSFSNIYISITDDGERDLAKHVKTVKENAC